MKDRSMTFLRAQFTIHDMLWSATGTVYQVLMPKVRLLRVAKGAFHLATSFHRYYSLMLEEDGLFADFIIH